MPYSIVQYGSKDDVRAADAVILNLSQRGHTVYRVVGDSVGVAGAMTSIAPWVGGLGGLITGLTASLPIVAQFGQALASLSMYVPIVMIGGQEANPLVAQMVKAGVFRPVTQADKSTWQQKNQNLFLIAGYSAADTMELAQRFAAPTTVIGQPTGDFLGDISKWFGEAFSGVTSAVGGLATQSIFPLLLIFFILFMVMKR
jgi:phage-related minor tail protein